MTHRKPAARRERSQRIQIYLIPSVEQDSLVLDVWKAAMMGSRAQEFFRDLLWKAIRDAHARGDIPPEIEKRCKVSQRVSASTPPPAVPQPQMMFMPHPGFVHPQPGTLPFQVHPAATPPETPGEDRTIVVEMNEPKPAAQPDLVRPPKPSRSDSKSENTRSRLASLMGDD